MTKPIIKKAKFKIGDMAYHKMGFTPIMIIFQGGGKYEGRLFTMEAYWFNENELLTAEESNKMKKEIADKQKKELAKQNKKK